MTNKFVNQDWIKTAHSSDPEHPLFILPTDTPSIINSKRMQKAMNEHHIKRTEQRAQHYIKTGRVVG